MSNVANLITAAAQKSMTKSDMEKRIAELEARLAESNKPRAISFKVSEKGAVSVYGLGRFPVTLYKEQWQRLTAAMPQLQEFITANDSKLSVKPAK